MRCKRVGIYCIANLYNNKKYIGQSVDINSRLSKHKTLLKNQRHSNKHLQDAYDKYGYDNFQFYIIEECDIELLDERECYYIELYQTCDRKYGYNIETGGNRYKTLSDETKEKLRLANVGKTISEDVRRKISASNKGKQISDEQKRFLSKYHTGLHHSDETRAKISEVQKIPVYCAELGVVFDSGKSASQECESYGVYKNGISLCIQGKQKHCGKHPFTGEPLTWTKFLKE